MKKAFGLLCFSLIPVLILVAAQAPLLTAQNEFQQIRQGYQAALDQTRWQLSEIAHTLRADAVLLQNIADPATSGVGRSLSGYIKPGQIDYLAVLDQNCHLIAHSEQGMPLTESCPIKGFTPQIATHLQWRLVGDKPRLELVQSLGNAHFLLAATVLGDTWIASQKDLKNNFREHDIVLGPAGADGVLLYEEGRGADQIAVASLFSKDPWLIALPQLLRTEPLTLQKPLWAALALLALAVFHLMRTLRRQRLDLLQAGRRLEEWASDLIPDKTLSPPLSAPTPKELVQAIEERINKLIKGNFEQIQKFQHQNHLLQQQVVTLESRLMEHQAEQARFHQVQSLHQQMLACAEEHLHKLAEVFSLGEDLSHLAVHQMARPSQKLLDLAHRWELELSQVSARKFVRSLSERVEADGSSELEQSLNFILEQSYELNNNAVNFTLLVQKLLQDLRINIQLAEHWHQMMGNHRDAPASLLSLLNSGQTLIQLQDPSLTLRYDNLLDDQAELSHLKVPSSTLTSAIYHCYLALIEAARARGASDLHLTSQLKKRAERSILVLSIKGDWQDEWTQDQTWPPKAEQHLYLAIQLIQSYPLKISQLPGLQGIQAITFMWEPAVTQVKDISLNYELSV